MTNSIYGFGADEIARERRRQIDEEGWTPEHDAENKRRELIKAASCYLGICGWEGDEGYMALVYDDRYPRIIGWPWDASWWKPSDDPIRNLVKAGALIAAEIDRLKAL